MNAPTPAEAADGKIIINPAKMRFFSRGHQKFIYWHECAHVVLGHSGATLAQEKEADCFAIRVLKNRERLTPVESEQIMREISRLPGDWAHLPGPSRAAYLHRCGLGSRSGTGQQRYRRYWHGSNTAIKGIFCYQLTENKQILQGATLEDFVQKLAVQDYGIGVSVHRTVARYTKVGQLVTCYTVSSGINRDLEVEKLI